MVRIRHARGPKRVALYCRRTGRSGTQRGKTQGTNPPAKGPVDSWLLFVVATLAMVGLMVVYAATYHLGGGPVRAHLVRTGVALLALLVGIKLRHTALAGWLGWALLVGVLVLLVLTAVLGRAVGVARRWLGFMQPAEMAKFVLPMWLAAYFADLRARAEREWNFRNSILKPGLVVGVFLVMTGLQPAIGTTAIMAASAMVMFFVVGVGLRYLVPIGVVAALGLVMLVRFTPYGHQRWQNFTEGKCYHQQQSLIAVGSGGLLGKGLGEGKQKFHFLPKLHTDFAVASIGEEFGFLGGLAVFLLYGAFLVRGMQIGRRATSHFGQYLATGIVVTVFMYALVHVGVVLALLPTTGQPLPFVSYGGSALVTNMFAAGVVLNVSRFMRHYA